MERRIDLKQAESEKKAIDALRAELEHRVDEPKAFSAPFVAHGKPPSPVPPSGA